MIPYNTRLKAYVNGEMFCGNVWTIRNKMGLKEHAPILYGNDFGFEQTTPVLTPHRGVKMYFVKFKNYHTNRVYHHLLYGKTALLKATGEPAWVEDLRVGHEVQDIDVVSEIIHKERIKKLELDYPLSFPMPKYKKFLLSSGLYVADYNTEKELENAH